MIKQALHFPDIYIIMCVSILENTFELKYVG